MIEWIDQENNGRYSLLTTTNKWGTEKYIEVHVNESIDKVMERYASGARDELTVYLYHVIEDYRKCMEHNLKDLKDYIVTYVQRINSMTAGGADHGACRMPAQAH